MAHKIQYLASRLSGTPRILTLGLATAFLSFAAFSQSPTPEPSPVPPPPEDYSVTGSIELGARQVQVNGAENKFRSDFNYRNGFRLFDSSLLIEDNRTRKNKLFDSALVMASGWGADPSGTFRFNVERDGAYKLDTNFRRVELYNNLKNHAIGESRINYHNYDIKREFGDLDLTVFPESPNFRLRVGASYNLQSDPFTFTSRASDVFPVEAASRVKAYDFRIGSDFRLLGFNLSGTYGFRSFSDKTTYRLLAPDDGDVVTGTRVILDMVRENPIKGDTNFGVLNIQRTFADRFDFTAKVVHSNTTMDSSLNESVLYRVGAPGTALTRDVYYMAGDARRPQTRADLGMTWRVTDSFRLSNTSTYDSFRIDGSLYSDLNGLTATGTSATSALNFYYNITRYERLQNTFEGDYQFSNRVGVNIGYRYTTRDVRLRMYSLIIRPNTPATLEHEAENTTHTLIAGTKIRPVKNWSIYADLEKGNADNLFTRAGNADFTNLRIRSIMRFNNRVAASVSYITKDNELPTDLTRTVPRITNTESRTFSATLDWTPTDAFNLSGGYNYVNLTSRATINFGASLTNGLSEYFVRDRYFFIDANVRPHRRFSFFGSYRWNKDRGHGDRVVPPFGSILVLGSYPMEFKTPEAKAVIRLTKHVDWNLGYQYYNYKESPPHSIQSGIPFQNYNAHLPYTSLRIYWGRNAADR